MGKKANPVSRKTIAVLLALLILFTMLRVFNVGHVVAWDEAVNALSYVEIAQGQSSSPFYKSFKRHPPIYSALGIAFAGITHASKDAVSTIMEILSLIFALAGAIVLFLAGREWFDDRTALFAVFFLAVMPFPRMFDTWIKPESLTLVFGLLFLLFLFRRKMVISGIFLGLALLTKEIAVFFVLAAFLFFLLKRRFRDLGMLCVSSVIAVAISAWWYLLVSSSTLSFTEFFLGKTSESVGWHRAWYYYLLRVPSDIGWPVTVLVLAALALVVVSAFSRKPEVAQEQGYSARDMSQFVLIWLVVVYLPMSLSYGKPPWMVSAAMPAFALLAGWTLSEIIARVSAKRVAAVVVSVMVLTASIGLSIPVSYASYMKGAVPDFEISLSEKAMAEYVNKHGGAEARLMLSYGDGSPRLFFYLEDYDWDTTVFLPGKVSEKDRIIVFNPDVSFAEAEMIVGEVKPDLLLLTYLELEGVSAGKLAAQFSEIVKPVGRGRYWVIFDGQALVETIGARQVE